MNDFTPLPALAIPGIGQDLASAPDVPVAEARMRLGKRAKAAVVVRLLLNEGADIPLETLPDDLQAALTEQMGQMGLVDRDTLSAVVAEFADELDGVGLTFPQGLAGALNALDGRISTQTAKRLRKEAGVRQTGDPWKRLKSESVETLKAIVEQESVEVAAVMLSKLDTGLAAKLLGHLPGPLARQITYAISLTSDIRPEAVDRIGLALAAQLDAKPTLAFSDSPIDRLGEILNQSTSLTRDDVLTGLDEADADFAQAVRKALFTFAHIPARIDGRDAGKLVRAVDETVMITALSYAQSEDSNKDAADFLLANMSSRVADNLREMMDAAGQPSVKAGEEALTQIVITARDLAEIGEIALLRPKDPEDTDES